MHFILMSVASCGALYATGIVTSTTAVAQPTHAFMYQPENHSEIGGFETQRDCKVRA